jgi:apolipoprotein N-acyltransferase
LNANRGRSRSLLLAAFLLGAATVAGFAPFDAFFLPILALAALLYLARQCTTPAERGRCGFAFGAGMFGAGVSWVYVSLHDFGMMPAPIAATATLLFCLFLALFPAITTLALGRLVSHPRTTALLLFPAVWTLMEWTRGWVFTGFPWLALGYSQTGTPLGAAAPLLGVYGVSFLTALCAGLLFLALTGVRRARLIPAAAFVVMAAGGYALSHVAWTSPVGSPLQVSLLQGNIEQDFKFHAQRYASTLATYRRLVEQSRGQLVVLPETAIPRFLDAVDPRYMEGLARVARERNGDILIGVPKRDDQGRYFNSLISLGTSPEQQYSKSHLVPFGEFVPSGFGWIVRVLSIPLSDFSRGPRDAEPLLLSGLRIAPNICYEDAFGEEIIRQLPQANLLVNVSNVAWFGNSLAPAQHLQMSRMRSIETGRYMLRSTNTGITALIDERGRVLAELPQFTEGVLEGQALGFSGATPYVRWGNLPVILGCLLALLPLAFRRRLIVGPAGESR